MRVRVLGLLVAVVAFMAIATPAQAIKGGVPDEGAHPYVGQLLFYDPSGIDPRFDDPGAWFNARTMLVSPTIVVTAGHCTFGTGTSGDPTPTGSGGNDVWISFAEEPDYSILPPSANFIPDDNEGRYQAWSTALNASSEWIRATAYPHPEYDDAAFFEHDLGVLVLSEPVQPAQYGQLPTEGLLSTLYAESKHQRYTAVGYGLEGSGPKTSFGGDTRRRAELRLVNLNGVLVAEGRLQRSSPATPTPVEPASATLEGLSSSPGHRHSSRSCPSARVPRSARVVRTGSTRPMTCSSSPHSCD